MIIFKRTSFDDFNSRIEARRELQRDVEKAGYIFDSNKVESIFNSTETQLTLIYRI